MNTMSNKYVELFNIYGDFSIRYPLEKVNMCIDTQQMVYTLIQKYGHKVTVRVIEPVYAEGEGFI